MFRSMLRSVASFALASIVLPLASPCGRSWAATPAGNFQVLAASRSGSVRCEWGSDALVDPSGGLSSLRVSRDENGLFIVTDPGHPNAPLTPHVQAPLATGWVALPPDSKGILRATLLESDPLPWPESLTQEERAVVLAELPAEAAVLSAPGWFHDAYGAQLSFVPLVSDGAGGLRYVRRARFEVERAVDPRAARDFSGGRSTWRAAQGRDGFESLYRATFLNYEEGRAWRRAPVTAARRGSADSFGTSSAPWVRIEIKKEDLYELTGQALEDLGVDLASVPPESLRLFTGSGVVLSETANYGDLPSWMDELPIEVDAGLDLSFDRSDRILFYAVGADGWYSQYGQPDAPRERFTRDPYNNVGSYWLTWGGRFTSGAPKRLSTVDGRGAVAPFATSALDRTHLEEDGVSELYDSRPKEFMPRAFPPFANWERFWWMGFRGEPGNNVFPIERRLPDPLIDQPVNVKLRVWGRNDTRSGLPDPPPDHDLEVLLNDHRVGHREWESVARQDIDSSGVWLREGTQRFVFNQLLHDDSSVAARVDRVLLAWIELEYQRQLLAHDDTLSVFTGGWSGQQSLEARGFSSTDARVLDVSTPHAPHWIQADNEADGASRRLRFRYDAGAGDRPGRLLFRSASHLAHPAALALDRMPDGGYLRDRTAPAQMIIITHHDFLASARALAEFRASRFPDRGHGEVAVVDVQDIYDEFSFGRMDPAAIRNFLQLARDQWNGGNPDDGPTYVLLFGDANFDFRGLLHQGAQNFIPTFEGNYDPSFFLQVFAPQFGSDDYFAFLDPGVDPALDVYMSRIPVETASQAQAVVDKITEYEADSPLDPWKSRVTLIADDRCQGVNEDVLLFTHTEQTEDLAAVALPHSLRRVKVYLLEYGDECEFNSKPAATDALRTSVNEGTLLVNYTGHGSEGQLADERVLDLSGVGAFTNATKPFFFVTASCSVGKYDHASVGLCEALLRSPAGGSFGAFSAAAVATSAGNAILNKTFFQVMFPGADHLPARPTGEAAALGKFRLNRPGDINSRRYVLMGDPAQRFATPERRIRLDLSDAQGALGDTLPRGARCVLRGDVRDADDTLESGFDGVADVLVYDSARFRHFEHRYGSANDQVDYTVQGAPVFRGQAVVENGHFELAFQVPSALATGTRGTAAIYVYAHDNTIDACGALDSLLVPERPAPPSSDSRPPQIDLAFDQPEDLTPGSTYAATFFDSSGVNITSLVGSRSVVQRIEANGELVSVLDVSDRVRFGTDYRRATMSGVLPADLPTGRAYELVLEASDNFNNRGSARLAFVLGSSGTDELTLGDIFNFPNPTEGPTRFFAALTGEADIEVKIFTVGGREIARLGPTRMRGTELESDGLAWDGRDADGDALGNGLYFYRLTARPVGGGKSLSKTGRLVVSQ